MREEEVDLSHLPGDASPLGGMTNLAGWLRQGIVHVRAEAERRGPVWRGRIGPNLSVWVTDPAAVAAIARNDEGLWSAGLGWRRFFDGVFPGETMDSPIGFDFETHREAPKVLAPAFAPKALEGYVRIATETLEPAVMGWRRDGRSSFKRDVRRLFAGVASRIFMGVDDPREAALLDGAMADFWSAPTALAKNTWISPW